MHCKALGGKIMIPGWLTLEEVKTSGHKSRFVVDVITGDIFRLSLP